MEDKKKFSLSTDTDLHFDMLADKSKLKLVPNFNMNEQINENEENDNYDDSSKSSLKSDKMDFNLDAADSFSDSSKDDLSILRCFSARLANLCCIAFDNFSKASSVDADARSSTFSQAALI